jgi:hypothetical protein
MLGREMRWVWLVLALGLVGCAAGRPLEQRTTHGPSAEESFIYRSLLTNGRPPNFDERRSWDNDLDWRISQYLHRHPEAANDLDVSTFKFYRRVAVGQTKEQVLILLGPPAAVTTDPAEIERLARRYAPAIKGHATEAWVYPLGWSLFFAGPRLVDITQYLER